MKKKEVKKIYKALRKLGKRIRKHWNHAKYMQYMSEDEKLSLRIQISEQGTELTPEELDDLIEIITLVQDTMDEQYDL